MTEKSMRLQIVVVHPTISVLVPTLFVLTLHSLLRGSLGLPPRFPDALILLCPGACVLEAIAGNAARSHRATTHWRIREVAVYLLAVLALLIFLRIPVLHLSYLAPMVLLSWAISFAIHGSLRSREELLRATEGREGCDLFRAMHQALALEGDAMSRLMAARRTTAVLSAGLLLAAAALVLVRAPLRPLTAVLLVLQALLRQIVGAALSAMAADQRLLGQNLRLDPGQRGRRLTYAGLGLAAGTAISLALARARPLLSITEVGRALERVGAAIASRRPLLGPGLRAILDRILAWLAGLFPPLPSVGSSPGLSLPPVSGEASPFARRLFFALGMTVIVLAIGLIIAFLTAPLGEKEFQEVLARKRPLLFLRRRLRLFLRLARLAVQSVRSTLAELVRDARRLSRSLAPARAAPAGAAVPSAPEVVLTRAAARRLRSTRQRALRAFRLLAAWTEGFGLEYHPHLGPLEFARQAARMVPGRASELVAMAELLERVLYGRHPAEPPEVALLERSVRSLFRNAKDRVIPVAGLPAVGLEPTRAMHPPDFESGTSTDSITPAER